MTRVVTDRPVPPTGTLAPAGTSAPAITLAPAIAIQPEDDWQTALTLQ